MLDPDWDERRSILDWKGLLPIHRYTNEFATGLPFAQGGTWMNYAKARHLDPLLADLHRLGLRRQSEGLRLASFGCGRGNIERDLFNYGWPVTDITLLEYDAALVADAERRFADLPIAKRFATFDFNAPEAFDGRDFDVLFFCHSIHHVGELERFLTYLRDLMQPHTIILGVDHFGPPRMQIEPEVRRIIERCFAALPPHLRRNLLTGAVEEHFEGISMTELMRADPTECPRSSDLRSLLFSLFETVDVRPMGGTILQQLLAWRAGNFRSESDMAVLEILMLLEEELIRARAIRSNDLFFVLRKGDRRW